MKKDFNKELVMTKKDKENFRALQNVGFVIKHFLKVMLK